MKAIEINTFLWGGTYNPIIPTYRRIPAKWKVFPFDNPSAKSIVSGYLDNFDPDYVVPMGECVNYSLDVGHRNKVDDVSEILASVEKSGAPKYGIGLFEILNYFFEEELKFHRRYPQNISIPRFGRHFPLFLASVFGKLPESIDNIFWDHFAEPLDAKRTDCSDSNYAELLDLQKLSLRRMTGLYLETKDGWRGRKQCVFFLDATKLLDIMDYWNLRAIGWNVIPVPKQFTQSDKTKLSILNLIKENYLPHLSNLEIHRRTTILKSRSISEDEHEHFLDLLEEGKIVSQTRYPRIWEEESREVDGVECCELESEIIEHDVSTDQESISFKSLAPNFRKHLRRSGMRRFANEIEWRLTDDRILFAEVIPEGDSEQALFIAGFGLPDEWRLFRKGLVYLCSGSERMLYLRSPHAEGVFTRWLKSSGWTVEISSAGRVARKMLQQLCGIMGTWVLAQEGIIQLLDKMNSRDEKSLSEEYVRSEIQKIANRAKLFSKSKREGLPHHLVASKVLQFGMKIQCPICTQSSWYSVKSADYELQCPRCLEQFSFPSTSKKVKWSYRALGPFSLSNQAHGAYSVLLTLRFFSAITFSNSAMTPLLSFTAEKEGMEVVESDLALFFQESKSRHSKIQLIFAECKTFNSFQKSDINKMVNLGKMFPGSVLVFATLKESLNGQEKAILRSVVNRSRKCGTNNRPFNPVLILTGTELISETHFAVNWEKVADKRAGFVQGIIEANFLELCVLTQQVYLDMEP